MHGQNGGTGVSVVPTVDREREGETGNVLESGTVGGQPQIKRLKFVMHKIAIEKQVILLNLHSCKQIEDQN